MKNKLLYIIPMAMFVLAFFFNSCSVDDQKTKEEEVTVEEALQKFNLALQSETYSLKKIETISLSTSENSLNRLLNPANTLTQIEAEAILLPLSQPTNEFLLDVGFGQLEIDQMFVNEEEKASTGVLFYNILEQAKTSHADDGNGSKTVDCLLEATGLTAALGAIGVLAGQALTKTAIKAAVKTLAKTVGKRALGAIGLALMVGEFIWCMNR